MSHIAEDWNCGAPVQPARKEQEYYDPREKFFYRLWLISSILSVGAIVVGGILLGGMPQ